MDRRTWGKGEADGRTGDGRTGGWHGEWRQTGGRADGRMRADGARTGRTGGRADGRTGGRRISQGKTPDLMRHLTWLWEIQRGRPRVIVKLPHLPPPSR